MQVQYNPPPVSPVSLPDGGGLTLETGVNILNSVFKNQDFKPGQWVVITKALSEDVNILIIKPTWAGKTLPIQFLGMINRTGYTLMLVPTTSLMMEQSASFRKLGAMVACPNADKYYHKKACEKREYWHNIATNIVEHKLKFLILSPERLVKNPLLKQYWDTIFRPEFLNRVFIDEVHLVASWGVTFRPCLKLCEIGRIIPRGIPMIGATATCTPEMMPDVCAALRFQPGDVVFRDNCDRPNIEIAVKITWNMERKIIRLKLIHTMIYVLKRKGGKIILFCTTPGNCIIMLNLIEDICKKRRDGVVVKARIYHGKMLPAEREHVGLLWKKGAINFICATTAFGMGVDTKDVRQVIFEGCPFSVVDYTQMLGRAGRDGNKSFVTSYLSEKTFNEALKVLAYGCFEVIHDRATGLKCSRLKVNHRLPLRFYRLCEMYYLLVNPFLCSRSMIMQKFAITEFERTTAWTSTCYNLKGQICSGCVRTRMAYVTANDIVWKRVDVFRRVNDIKRTIVQNLLHPGVIVEWKRIIDMYGGQSLLATWAILELFLVDNVISAKPQINVKTKRVKHIFVELRNKWNQV